MLVTETIRFSCLLHWSNYWNLLYIYTNHCDLLCCFPEIPARLYFGLPLWLLEAEYFWKRRCWRLRRRESWSCYCWLVNWQGLLLSDMVWICWDVWGQGGGCKGCNGFLELTVWGQGCGCNGCEGLLELTVWGQGGGYNGCEVCWI